MSATPTRVDDVESLCAARDAGVIQDARVRVEYEAETDGETRSFTGTVRGFAAGAGRRLGRFDTLYLKDLDGDVPADEVARDKYADERDEDVASVDFSVAGFVHVASYFLDCGGSPIAGRNATVEIVEADD